MNHRQKLGYMALGAGILAVGIIIGQWTTPDIKAQNNGVFDKIQCRELEVVDAEGRTVIEAGTGNGRYIYWDLQIYNKRGAIVIELGNVGLPDTKLGHNAVFVYDNKTRPAVSLESYNDPEKGNSVQLYSPSGKLAIDLESDTMGNWILVEDVKEVPRRAAFHIYSNADGNHLSRWIRGTGRRVNW
jgi:hypothetical protein